MSIVTDGGSLVAKPLHATQLLNRLDQHETLARSPRLRRLLSRPIRVGRVRMYRLLPGLGASEVRARLFSGRTLQVVLPEVLAWQLYLYGFHEASLTRALLTYLKPGMVFADVGAHYGYYSVLAADLVGDTGKVFAFEPTPRTYELLMTNISGLANVRAEKLAVYSERGVHQFRDFGVRHSAFNTLLGAARLPGPDRDVPRPEAYEVHAIPLDDYFGETGPTPDFVKIDAESAELQILHGMARLLGGPAPIISLETGDYDIAAAAGTADCLSYLSGFGYRPFEYVDGRFRPHRPRETYEYSNLLLLKE